MSRITSGITSVSWIPSEAITGVFKLGMVLGLSHYDPPPPDQLDDLEALRAADRFRFANDLRAQIDVDDDGQITGADYLAGGLMGSTTVTVGGISKTIPGVAFPDLQHDPEYGDGWVRFRQTTGGRTGSPMPRTVNRPPFVQITPSTVWTTLELSLHADGHVERRVAGASPFPRHWIYDDEGTLIQKSGTADFKEWMGDSFGDRDPWSDHDREALVADAETALERTMSSLIMQGGAKPRFRKLNKGATLVEQGDTGDELYLVLDDILTIEVDGDAVAEAGPGTILGERAVLEGGTRTSTVRARTPARVAVAGADQIDIDALTELAEGHRREEQGREEQGRQDAPRDQRQTAGDTLPR
ncbi:hypothetical protein BH24ACT15_BH24ACT15_29100 [soil metagenome]